MNDLKLFSGEGHTSVSLKKEMGGERWSYHILPTDQLCSFPRISPVRKTLQRQLKDQELLLLGPIPMHGLRPADLLGKPERYPGMPASGAGQAVSGQLPFQVPLLSTSGQVHWSLVRLGYHHQEFLCPQGLSREASPDPVPYLIVE